MCAHSECQIAQRALGWIHRQGNALQTNMYQLGSTKPLILCKKKDSSVEKQCAHCNINTVLLGSPPLSSSIVIANFQIDFLPTHIMHGTAELYQTHSVAALTSSLLWFNSRKTLVAPFRCKLFPLSFLFFHGLT